MPILPNPDGTQPDNSEEIGSSAASSEEATVADLPNEPEPEGWDSDKSWEMLLYAIEGKQCTPFLGAGASAGALRGGKAIAEDWAKSYHYPFKDSDNLPRVSQFVSLVEEGGQLLPRFKLKEEFGKASPDFTNPNEPHLVVAGFGLPIYITTNYDSFMVKALRQVGKDPITEVCQWHKVGPSDRKDPGLGSNIAPTSEQPVVFHLHGNLDDLDSMVLTDDDYLNFLINTSQYKVIPEYIEAAARNTAVLFIGYSLEDMTFKVLFRKFAQQIADSPGSRHVAVQLPGTQGPSGEELTEDQKNKQRRFLQEVFKSHKVRVYWGDAQKFTKSLGRRWNKFKLRGGSKNGD
jgi:hypothetical protein